MAATAITTKMAGAINYTYVTDTSADWAAVPNSTYFYDKADKLVHYKNSTGTVLEIFSAPGVATNIYTADGTLTGARNVDLNGYNFNIQDLLGSSTINITTDDGLGSYSYINMVTGSVNITASGSSFSSTLQVTSSGVSIYKSGSAGAYILPITQPTANQIVYASSTTQLAFTSLKTINSNSLLGSGNISVGTVTSVAALTLGTSGTDLSSTVATGTTTPVITLNVPTASATNRGALSSADWSTFNGKQNAITLTTTGTSGAATLVGSTLNIPDYSSGFVNIYNTDGTLTADRVVSQNGFSLTIDGQGAVSGAVLNLKTSASNRAKALNYYSGSNLRFKLRVSGTELGGNTGSVFAIDYVNDAGTTGTALTIGRSTGALFIANAYTLPVTDGTNGQALLTNGAGAVSFSNVVTSVGLTTGTTGTDVNVSGSPVTGSGSITLNVPTASATNRGVLSPTDWTTFNNKANTASPAFTGTPTAPTAATGTNTTQVATTAFVQDAVAKQPEAIQAACSDETTNLTTGVSKITFRMPYAMTLTAVRASLSTAQTAGALLTVDINLNGVSVLGTKLTFDNTEKTTVTAATPATIVTSALTDDGEITVDIDTVGTAGAKGLKITLIGTRA